MERLIELAERGVLPDWVIRIGIRILLRQRLRSESLMDPEEGEARFEALLGELRSGPIAVDVRAANDQHYALPSEFFELVLGPQVKYSCAFWGEWISSLDDAEELALAITAERAELQNGMRILDLGCGWGSFSCFAARTFPQAHIVAVSNSPPQGDFLRKRCRREGLSNIEVLTADVNSFSPEPRSFDRVVSIEAFEHVRNHEALLRRISSWLTTEGKLFVHIFCHRKYPYLFETEGAENWMGRYFFTGGMMPSEDLLLRVQGPLECERQWRWNGDHYARTSAAWRSNLDHAAPEVRRIFESLYGKESAKRWVQRWRIFFLAVEELFGFRGGNEWFVAHYRFRQRGERE